MAQEQFNLVLAALREQFVAQLPEKMNAIAQRANCIGLIPTSHAELTALHRLIHNLSGAAGTFGLRSLSEMARQTEQLLDHFCNTEDKLEQQTTGEALHTALQRLQRLARSIPDSSSPTPITATASFCPKAQLSPLIYLIEDDSQQGQQLHAVLEEAGYRSRLLDGLAAFSAALHEDELPAAIIMDMVFPDGDLAGARYIQQQRQEYPGIFPPVIFVSVRQDLDARLAAYRSGAAHYLNKPVSSERLLRLLEEVTHRIPSEPYRVLMVDDEPLMLEAQASMLRAAGMNVSTLQNPRQLLEQMRLLDPEVLVLDFHMPDISGSELAALLREDESYSQLPIVFLSAEPDPYWQSQALSLGGDDFLQKPIAPQHLISRVSARARRAREQRANRSEIQQLLYEREREHLALNQHAIVSVANQAGNITYVNDLFCDISGYSRSELLGKNHRLLKSGAHADSYYQEIWATIVSGQTWFGEICNRRKDGSFYWVESTITPFLDDTGEPYQYVSIRTDISHVKAVEQELARLSQVASQTTNGVVITDTEGRVEWINDGFTRISGYTLDDILGRKPGDFLQGRETDPCTVIKIREALARGEGFRADLVNYTKEHNPYWIRIQCNPLYDDKGTLQGFMAIESDVTQEKDDAERLSATLESTNDAILAVDDSGEVLFMNLQFRQMWNLPDYLVKESDDNKLLAHAITQLLDPQGFMLKVNALYQSTEESDDLIELSDGRIFERHSKPLRRDRKAVGRVWSFHDITERLRAEQAADAAKERLRRGQFYANIGTWEWNIVTDELFWTERIAPLFGYPDGDLETSYDNFLAAVHSDDRQAVIDAVAASVEQDVPYDIEHRVVWPDGRVRWLLERGAVKRDAEGKPLVMIGVVQDIDVRKRAELALAEREQQLLEAQTLASIGNWSADWVSGELIWSDEVYRIFGHQPGSFTPSVSAFYAAIHPDDRELVQNSERQAEQTGRHDVTHRILQPDGVIRHVHELAQMHFDNTGKPIRLTGTTQDVTERIEAEQRLNQTEQRFAFAVEGAGDAVWDWDVTSGRMLLSDNYAPMLGYQKGEMEPSLTAWIASVHPDDLEHAQQQLINFMEGRSKRYHEELRLRCKDGNYKWILCRGTVVERNDRSEPLRLIGIHSDIDARKLAEKTLQIFKHVVNSVVDGVLVIDASGVIQHANPSVSAIFGYDQQILLGKKLNMLMPEPVRSQHDAFIQHYHFSGEAKILNRQVEMVGQKSDGTEFPLEVAVSEIHVGQNQYFVGLLRDISVRKQAEQALVNAREEAERANQAKSSFLSSMSHELRTPMNAILGFAQILEYDSALDADQQDNVHEILKAGTHLLELINEVLDLSKVESGQLTLSLEAVEVCPVVQECLSLIQPLAQKRKIRIDFTGLEPVWVRADRTRLKQVLLNLLSNAVKYNCEYGEVRLEIVHLEQDRVRILVNDTGKGIPSEKLGGLFAPFNRLDAESTEVEGTGIGLTITRRLMELMGGSVDAESEVDVGSTFWLEFQLESETQGKTLSTQHGEAENAQAQVEQVHLVLYIEDNPANLKLVSSILDRLPYMYLLTAHLPELGLELAHARKPALILLDINLPGMDGYQVLQILKQDAELKKIPVIAITANAMPQDIERGKQAGFADYITKPIEVDDFLDSVNYWLGKNKNSGL